MENCTFCGSQIPVGTGKMYVKKDARILYFCSRRCEKNLLKLGRNPRTTTFTEEAKKSKKQQMAAKAHAQAKEHGADEEEPKNHGSNASGSRKPKVSEEKAPAKKAPAKKAKAAPAADADE
jgi:large subunit ribosomal protein L24e